MNVSVNWKIVHTVQGVDYITALLLKKRIFLSGALAGINLDCVRM